MKILRTFDLGPGRHESGMKVLIPEGNLKQKDVRGKSICTDATGSIRHDIALKAKSASVSH